MLLQEYRKPGVSIDWIINETKRPKIGLQEKSKSMAVEIRCAESSDYKGCVKLLSQLQAATRDEKNIEQGEGPASFSGKIFEQLLTGERGRVLVAEETDEELLGMATVSYNLALRYDGEYCQLEELIVDPNARGKNVGGLLVIQTVDDARTRGCQEFGLYLLETTEHNRPFYEKYGFKGIGSEMRQVL
jgi:GNAT superfamily N-acetyltransferase